MRSPLCVLEHSYASLNHKTGLMNHLDCAKLLTPGADAEEVFMILFNKKFKLRHYPKFPYFDDIS
jgi:hypothetical protein